MKGNQAQRILDLQNKFEVAKKNIQILADNEEITKKSIKILSKNIDIIQESIVKTCNIMEKLTLKIDTLEKEVHRLKYLR